MNDSNSAQMDIYAIRGMATPWGPASFLMAKNPDKSVIVASTCSHGGIGVHIPTHSIPEHFKTLSICVDSWAWFEEDCAWAAAALMFPDLFPKDQDFAKSTLCNWYPRVYEAHFGSSPSAAQSMVVRQNEILDRLKNHFTVKATWGDWAWDVPQGKIYVLGRRTSDGVEAGFLLPSDDYKSPIDEIILDAYPRWEPDRTLPLSKPKEAIGSQQPSNTA